MKWLTRGLGWRSRSGWIRRPLTTTAREVWALLYCGIVDQGSAYMTVKLALLVDYLCLSITNGTHILGE
jgi:hypothetical protein